jgi:hypothetical protein
MAPIEFFPRRLTRATPCRRTSLGARPGNMMAKCGKHLSSQLADHGSGIVRAQGPLKDQVVSLAVPADHLQSPTEALLDETELGAHRPLAPLLRFPPLRAPPFPWGLFCPSLGRRVAVCWAMWFQHHRGGRAALNAPQG